MDIVKELEEVRKASKRSAELHYKREHGLSQDFAADAWEGYERILSQIAVVMENISACGNCVAGQDCDHCDCVERDAKARRIIKAIKGVKK